MTKKWPHIPAALSILFIAGAVLNGQGSGPSQPKGAAVSVVRTLHDCNNFKETKIHPNRYILTSMKKYQSSPFIYDIYEDRFITLPGIESLSGIPSAPELPTGRERAYKKSELVIKNQYFQWRHSYLVHYSPEKGKAGFVLWKESINKTIPGAPSCPECRVPTRLVEKYHRYLCDTCRKYVNESVYTAEASTQYYAVMDLSDNRITAMHELPRDRFFSDDQDGIESIGVDPSGTSFYYSNRIFFYKSSKTSGHIVLYRLDIPSGKADMVADIKVPVRFTESASSVYSVKCLPSADFSRIAFWEHDEAVDGAATKGSLSDPGAMVWIVDTASGQHFSAGAPLTAYGQLFDRENGVFLLGSNQTGYIHRYSMEKKSEDMKVQAEKTMYKMVLSSGSKHLYVFNKRAVEVRSWPSLKLASRIPLSKIFPGVTILLASEQVYSSDDGRYAAMGILKKAPNGPWWSSVIDDGFNLMALGD